MRRIEAKTAKEKREKRKGAAIGIFLVVIMVLGTVGYGFLSRQEAGVKSNKETYKGTEFIMTEQGFWWAEISGYGFYFQHLPKEAENISVPFARFDEFSGKPLYFVLNDGSINAKSEIYRNLQAFTLRLPQDACLAGQECDNAELPEENCSSKIIIFNKGNETIVERDENCIFISSPADDMTRAADAFLYRILGII